MKPLEFADKHLEKYKIRDGNIVAEYCPFCQGGQHNDKWTFGMRQDNGAYNCFRGKCNAKGSFYELLKAFNEDTSGVENTKKYKKADYKKPEVRTTQLGDKVLKYLKLRSFSEKTISKLDIKEKEGNIAFLYYQNNELVLVKYRTASKKKSYWQEGGGRPVLWNMENCSTDQPLLITEGEMDTVACVEAGYENAVSVPFGSEDLEWIEMCWDFLEQFDEIILWTDADKAGEKMRDQVITRLGKWRCKTVRTEHNDANVMLYKKGKGEVLKAIKQAEPVPIDRVINLADVSPLDLTNVESSKSSLNLLNKYLGGFMMGYISVWTGANASGKSTFLGQEMLEAVDQGYGAGVYSGELRPDLFQYWINLQACGPNHYRLKHHSIKDELVPYVPKEVRDKITSWYDNKLFYYDIEDTSDPDKILETFENLYRRYGIRTFYIDNLMTISYGGHKSEYYHRQSEFITKCKTFAQRLNVHIHIVAHPKKTNGRRIKKEDIAGLYEITNKADNVLVIHRIDNDNKKSFPRGLMDCDNIVDILKSRIYGQQKISIGLGFEKDTKRFYYHKSQDDQFKTYGWESEH